MKRKRIRELEHGVLQLLSTKRGGKNYKTYELMYELLEYHKIRERFLEKIVKEIGSNYFHM